MEQQWNEEEEEEEEKKEEEETGYLEEHNGRSDTHLPKSNDLVGNADTW